MRRLKRRLDALEARMDTPTGIPDEAWGDLWIDYVGIFQPTDEDWEEVFRDNGCKVYRHRQTGDFKGIAYTDEDSVPPELWPYL